MDCGWAPLVSKATANLCCDGYGLASCGFFVLMFVGNN